jgi:histidinol-phosphate aminotransferase
VKRTAAERRLVRDLVRELPGYQPVESLESVARETGYPPETLVKLDANENPYGPSPRVLDVLTRPDHYHLYPDASQRAARQALAAYTGAEADRIVVGNGSDELIDLLLLATIEPGDEVIVPVPTFGVYLARPPLFGATVRAVPRREDFELDITSIEGALNERTKLVFLASPNNPTGNLVTSQQLVRVLRTGVVVVLDEAYYEFAGRTLLPLSREFDNLVVLRTFSKWAGLAGLRAGYGIFPPELAQAIWQVKAPFNVNALALRAIEAALVDLPVQMQKVVRIRLERGRLYRGLRRIPLVQPLPSRGNFILCRVTRGDAHDVHRRLLARGILVRKYSDPLLRPYLRITVGLPEQTDRVLQALGEIATEVES